jgi:nucleotide-binding universal stress UspA family protein
MINLKTILVPSDFSECSDAALRYGLELARRFDARLHLLHVVQDPLTQPWAAE